MHDAKDEEAVKMWCQGAKEPLITVECQSASVTPSGHSCI